MPVDPISPLVGLAYDALNMMGGSIDWAGLEVVMELLGVDDIEPMIRLMRLVLINEKN